MAIISGLIFLNSAEHVSFTPQNCFINWFKHPNHFQALFFRDNRHPFPGPHRGIPGHHHYQTCIFPSQFF